MFRILSLCIITILGIHTSSLQAEIDKSKYILVTGGAGFIGSHVNEMLYQNGYQTLVLDNLISGNQKNVLHGTFIQGDVGDTALLDWIFTTYPVDAVMHFAAFLEVGESVKDPLKYYKNNISNAIFLLEAMLRHNVNVFIFSSSASIFGLPSTDSVVEDSPYHPLSPYGQTKLMMETILQDVDHAHNLRYGSLRYFNVAGGDPEGNLKNYQKKPLNLIPIVLRSIQKPDGVVTILGTDYKTLDGTCIRDYIHVQDLASAHIASLEKLLNGSPSHVYNLGNGRGYSVQEVINAVEKVTGILVNTVKGPRREGDAAIIVANAEKASLELNWTPKYPSIELMVEHAWMAMQD